MRRNMLFVITSILLSIGFMISVSYSIKQMFLETVDSGKPVEPQANANGSGMFDLWFENAEIYDLSVDRDLTWILFCTEARKATLLDRERRIRWERTFNAQPTQAQISDCGGYFAIGTGDGKLFYFSTDQMQLLWEVEQEAPVYSVAISANGKWVAVGSGEPEHDRHTLSLYDSRGNLQWELQTALLEALYISGEQQEYKKVFFTEADGETVSTSAVGLEQGERQWSHEQVSLLAISQAGSRLVGIAGDTIMMLNFQGQLLWERSVPVDVEKAAFNPQNFNVLVYGKAEGGRDNLFYYDRFGEPLWRKRIADGSLLAFTPEGRQIVTGSWRHYKEDYSQMFLLDENGQELSSWDVAMRVEHLLASGNRRYIVLAGQDGYIEPIDLLTEYGSREEGTALTGPFYRPAVPETNKDYTAITLFFLDDSDNLVPVTRLVNQNENPIRTAIEELIRGPARESALYRSLPKDAGVGVRFQEETGELFIELSPELVQPGGTSSTRAALESLCLTLGQFPQIRHVYLTRDNEVIEEFGSELLEQPFVPPRWNQPVYVPVRTGHRYYLVPREARDLRIEQRDLDGLLKAVIKEARWLYFIPTDLQLLSVTDSRETVTVDLNSAFHALFPADGGEMEQLQAAMLLDALFFTIMRNSPAKEAYITVEGKSWTPPAGYPSVSRDFKTKWLINPE